MSQNGAAMRYEGAWTALVTPFVAGDASRIDWDALDALVDAQIAAGITALVPCGTTGESPTLTHDEHDQVIERVVKRAAGRVPVVAGTGSNSTAEALRLTRHAAEVGADAALVVCPYYNRPSQRMLRAHYGELAEHAPIPLVLYNVPARTGVKLEPETIADLFDAHEHVAAIKEACGSVAQVARIRELCAIPVVSGDDLLTVPMMSAGATGVISVASNVAPGLVVSLVCAALAGEWDTSHRLHQQLVPLYRALFVEPNPVPVKAAAHLLGICSPLVRAPLLAALPETADLVRSRLSALDLI